MKFLAGAVAFVLALFAAAWVAIDTGSQRQCEREIAAMHTWKAECAMRRDWAQCEKDAVNVHPLRACVRALAEDD